LEDFYEFIKEDTLKYAHTMTIPNFFIVGAQKCGTTALSEYLRSHPKVFMTNPKEPHFFAEDFGNYRPYKTLDQYLALYRDCSPRHKAVGEASPTYICSKVAVRNIHKFNSWAKIIAMLRNPVDLVYSLHQQNTYAFHENVMDFESAWRLQEARSRGEHIPPFCDSPLLLQYFEIGRLGAQMERVYSSFSREQVHVILFEDFVSNTARHYAEALRFLEVPHDGRSEFPPVNEGKVRRFPWLWRLFYQVPHPVRGAVEKASVRLGMPKAKMRLKARLSAKVKRKALSPAFMSELRENFREDVQLLGGLIGRDLNQWMEQPK
jgi:hypothetical protein